MDTQHAKRSSKWQMEGERKLYRGKEPCQGCGRPGHEQTRWGKDKLCSDCREVLNSGAHYLMARQEIDPESMIRIQYQSADFKMTTYRREVIKILNDQISALLRSIAIGVKDPYLCKPVWIGGGNQALENAKFDGVILKSQWAAIEQLIVEINTYLETYIGDVKALEQKAFDAGRNALVQICKNPNLLDEMNYSSTLK